MTQRRRLLVTTVVWTSAALAVGAQAQPVSSAPAGAPPAAQNVSDTSSRVGEVVVTARKIAENLQTTPIAVTAVGAPELRARSIQNIGDLSSVTPSLHAAANTAGGANSQSFFIRGVGQIDFLPTTDPGVGVYIDGIYLARTTGDLFDLGDIAQVEVLRGPQGTLFGKNTEGGAISVTTRRPTGALDGVVDLTYGNFNRRDIKASGEFPIIADTLAGAVSVVSRNQDGYGQSLVTGQRLGSTDLVGARIALNYTGPNKSSYYLTADYTTTDDTNPPEAILGVYPSALRAAYYGAVVSKLYPGSTYTSALITSDPLTTYNDANDKNAIKVGGVSGIGSVNLGGVTLKSLTGFRVQSVEAYTDTFAVPIPIFNNTRSIDESQFTQEFQAIGSAFDGRLNFVGGVFYEHELAKVFTNQDYFPGSYSTLHFDAVELANSRQLDDSYAGYGNINFKITEKLSVTGGLRYSVERKSISQVGDYQQKLTSIYDTPAGTALPLGSVISAARTFSSATPTVGLQYKATKDAFFYATYAEGFKSGGFDGRPVAGIPTPASFNPEHVTNYEVGSKLDLFDHRARLNTALFWTQYNDLTVQAFVSQPNGLQVQQITNAGNARVRGVEIEATVIPVKDLELTANGSYLDAHLTKLAPGVVSPSMLFTINDHLQQTPKYTANLSAAYRQPFLNGGSLRYRLDYVFTSTVYSELPDSFAYNATGTAITANGPNFFPTRQPSYGLLNARLTYAPGGERWSLSGFATNLTDVRYRTYGYSSTSFGTSVAYFGAPREFGAQLTVKFR